MFRKLILRTFDNYGSSVRDLSGQAAETQGIIEQKLRDRRIFRVENSVKLERLFPPDGDARVDLLEQKRFLCLEPILVGGHILPVLALRCNFRNTPEEVRLEVGLFLIDVQGELRAIGCRFETPEGTTGRHHYHHAQLFRAYRREAGWSLPGPPWLPIEQPAFVLSASDGVTLLLNLLVSLYGLSCLVTLQAGVGNIMKGYVEKMALG